MAPLWSVAVVTPAKVKLSRNAGRGAPILEEAAALGGTRVVKDEDSTVDENHGAGPADEGLRAAVLVEVQALGLQVPVVGDTAGRVLEAEVDHVTLEAERSREGVGPRGTVWGGSGGASARGDAPATASDFTLSKSGVAFRTARAVGIVAVTGALGAVAVVAKRAGVTHGCTHQQARGQNDERAHFSGTLRTFPTTSQKSCRRTRKLEDATQLRFCKDK